MTQKRDWAGTGIGATRRDDGERNDVGERRTCLDNTEDARGVMTGRRLVPEDDPDPHLGDPNLSLPSVGSRNESPEKFKNLGILTTTCR